MVRVATALQAPLNQCCTSTRYAQGRSSFFLSFLQQHCTERPLRFVTGKGSCTSQVSPITPDHASGCLSASATRQAASDALFSC